MPTVLVITEQERVRRLFTAMGESRRFRLRLAPSLAQGEEEIALRLPHYVFVENDISGMSGATILGYLRDLLPEEVEVILMTRDGSESEQFREAGGLFSLDLSLGDEALGRAVGEIVQLGAPRLTPLPPPREPLPVSEKTARKLLFEAGPRDSAIRDKRLLWLIPLVLVIAALSVFAYRLGRSSAPAARQYSANVAAPAEHAGTERSPAQNPAAPQQQALQPAGAKAAAPAETTAPSRTAPAAPAAPAGTGSGAASRTAPGVPADTSPGASGATPGTEQSYLVQPGDTLLKILVKGFGFSYQDATRTIPELQRRNGLGDAKRLKPGQALVIPARPKPELPAKRD